MLKKKLLLAWVVLLPSYSYSDSITPYYGYTGNAAAGGNTWSMGTVLPDPPGLDINGVIYNYTINKDVDDSVKVHVQNENALGTGYIFRETDQWNPGSLGGTQINKAVPVIPGIPREAFRFIDRPYSSDEHLDGAFRHHIGLDEPGMFPNAWIDLSNVIEEKSS